MINVSVYDVAAAEDALTKGGAVNPQCICCVEFPIRLLFARDMLRIEESLHYS